MRGAIPLHAQPRSAIDCCVTGDGDGRGLKNNGWTPNHILLDHLIEEILAWIHGCLKVIDVSVVPLVP